MKRDKIPSPTNLCVSVNVCKETTPETRKWLAPKPPVNIFFARDAPDMSYQSGRDVMGSFLPFVTHMQKLCINATYIQISIGYTIHWEYIKKYNTMLTKYMVKTIEYLVDFMSKQDRKWFLFLSNYELTSHLEHFRMKWVYVPIDCVLLWLLWWFKKNIR